MLLLPLFATAAPGTPAAASTQDAESSLAQAKTLLPDRPQAALALLEPLWADAGAPNRAAIAVPLVRALVALKRDQRALEVAATVANPQSELSLDERAFLLRFRIRAATNLREFSVLETTAAEFDALQQAPLSADLLGELWNARAGVFTAQGKHAQAEADCRRGLALAGETDSPIRQKLLEHLGVSLTQQSRLPDAIEAFLASERVTRALGQEPNSMFLSNIAAPFLYAKDFPRAIDYLERAQRAADAEKAPPARLVSIHTNLGIADDGQANYESATRHFEEALRIARAHDLPYGNQLNNLAGMLRQAGRLEDALAVNQQALRYYEKANDASRVPLALGNIADNLAEMGQRERAAEYFQRAYQGYLKIDVRPLRLRLYPRMIDNLETLGRTAEGLSLMREYMALSEETVNVESNERIAKLESAIDLAHKEQELAISERDRLEQQSTLANLRASRENERLVGIGMAAGLAILALLALLLYRQLRFKARANQLLQEKNREIERQHAHLAELNETIRLQSLRDALTGLPNRRFLDNHMRDLMQAQGDPRTVRGLLVMIDIDHFKRINDQFGHLVGDRALVHVADALRGCLREDDVLVRWGGEEFLWLAHGASLAQAPKLCERIRDALHRHPFEHAGMPLRLTVSMGFAPRPLWPVGDCDWMFSLRMADDALYAAKTSGRDRWIGYAPGTTPKLPLESGVVASALESAGHLVRQESLAHRPTGSLN
jgi:diguanylate cyclase (GGDEF)-like protein